MTADEELLGIVREIELVEEDIRDRNKAKSDIYKAAAEKGYDKKAIRKVVAVRRLDPFERGEQDQIFETYLDAVERAEKGTVRAHVEIVEKFDPVTGEFLDDDNTPSDAPRTSVSTVTAPLGDSEGEAASSGLPVNSLETANEMDRATDSSFETGSEAAENARKAIPVQGPTSLEDGDVTHAGAGEIPATYSEHSVIGGDHEVDQSSAANAKTGAEVSSAPVAHKPLRPLCRHPGEELCGGYGSTHCNDCLKIAGVR